MLETSWKQASPLHVITPLYCSSISFVFLFDVINYEMAFQNYASFERPKKKLTQSGYDNAHIVHASVNKITPEPRLSKLL